jgi:hypothetical protein
MRDQRNQVVSRNARTAIVRSLESKHPNMVVFAGPFEIQSADLAKRDREIEACTQMKAEFQAAKVPVKVVLSSVGAWVLRAKDGLQRGNPDYQKSVTGKHGHTGSKRGGQWRECEA